MGEVRRRLLGSAIAVLVLGLLAAGVAVDLGGELVALPYEYTVS